MWRDIKGFEGLYQISNEGQIKTVATQKLRLVALHPSGYLFISLYKKGKTHSRFVHRLLAESFIDNPDGKREVNHIDGDKQNNELHNLQWATTTENVMHALKLGLMKTGEDHVQSKLSNEDTNYIRKWFKPRDTEYGGKALAKKFGVSTQLISAIVTGVARRWH